MKTIFAVAMLSASVGLAMTSDSVSLGREPLRLAARSSERQQPACRNEVVSCNYAYLYDGNFGWINNLQAPNSQHFEQVTITSLKGVANCIGTVREVENGVTRTGQIKGPGLIGIQFELDSLNKLVYRITGACPSVAGMGSPVRPADLSDSRETYEQRATVIGQTPLAGTSRYPAPETDPVNSVTGQVQVSWSFHR